MKNAILAIINLEDDKYDFEEKVEECISLCNACGIEVKETIIQASRKLDQKTAFRKGKYEELVEKSLDDDIDLVVFGNNLSIAVLARLQKDIGKEVIDRTTLILDIFSLRAKTKEAKIQTQIARLRYNMPKMVELELDVNRQRGSGSSGGGAYNRGSGETRVEVSRRKIGHQITELKKQLKDIETQKITQKKQREKTGLKKIALVGYTNAGKSSLMNTIIEYVSHDENKKVFEENMLFATLDTSVRNVSFMDGKKFLLFDTVGFVSDLPTLLVEAFKSTLEAALDADLLVQVIDISNPHNLMQKQVTEDTLKQIGADNIPMLCVYNKIDLLDEEIDGVKISCINKTGIKELLDTMESLVYKDVQQFMALIPYEKQNVISYYIEKGLIKIVKTDDNGTTVTVNGTKEEINDLRQFEKNS